MTIDGDQVDNCEPRQRQGHEPHRMDTPPCRIAPIDAMSATAMFAKTAVGVKYGGHARVSAFRRGTTALISSLGLIASFGIKSDAISGFSINAVLDKFAAASIGP